MVHVDNAVFNQAWDLTRPLASIPALYDLCMMAAYFLSAIHDKDRNHAPEGE